MPVAAPQTVSFRIRFKESSLSRRSDRHVLIVSTKLDVATDAVVKILNDRAVRCTRWNTEDLPFDQTFTARISSRSRAPSLSIECAGSVVSLEDVTSIWYRRLRVPERPRDIASGIYDFCVRESRASAIGGILLQEKRIMSPPAAIWAAEHKLLQLQVARTMGLAIPETVVTNDPAEVRAAFSRFNGQMIAKPVRSGFLDMGDEQYAVYTSQVLEEHLADVENAHWSPTIYQPLLPKQCDVRVTAVGGKLYIAEIESQKDPSALIDWRKTTDPELPHRRGSLPSAVTKRLLLTLRCLNLQFAAVDFVRTPSNEFVFLEINPNGQWLWIDDALNTGISAAVADWLSGEDTV